MPDGMILPGLRISGGGPRELLPNDPINRGLIAFWPLDQAGGTVARDIAPRRRHGTLFNATSPWEAAPHGRALRFDGVNDYVNLGGRWLAGLSSGTFACRFKPNAGGGVLYYEDGGGFNNFALDCPSPGTSALAFYIGSNTLRNSTSRTWVAGQWYDLAITWGDAIRVYINGALDTTISAVVATSTNPGDNDQLARYSFGGGTAGAYTPASMSHVRPYSRALLAAEVARLRLDPWAGTTSPAERLFHAVRLASSAASVSLTGIGLTSAAGTLAAAITAALVGTSAAGASGTASSAIAAAATGAAVTLSAGSLAYSLAFSLTGQAATSAAGTLTGDASGTDRTLTGIQMTALPGNVRVTGGTRWYPQAPRTETPGSVLGNTLPPPPRATGDDKADLRALNQWVNTLYDQWVKGLNLMGKVQDHDARIARLENEE